MNSKRILSILLAFSVLVVSLIIPSAGIISNAEGGVGFTAQHMDVDFTKYTVSSDYKGKYHMYSTGDAGAATDTTDINWSFPEESGNKFLRYEATARTKSPGSNKYSYNFFIPNASGDLPSGGSGSFQLASGATYRISFKYRLATTGTAKSVELHFSRQSNYRGTGNLYAQLGARYNDAIPRLNATDSWAEKTVILEAGSFTEAKSTLSFFIRIGSSVSPITGDATYQLDIDDFQVDRIGTVNVQYIENGEAKGDPQELTFAAKCEYNKKFFSSTSGDFAGGILDAATGKYIAVNDAVNSATAKAAVGLSNTAEEYKGLFETSEVTTPIIALPALNNAKYYAIYGSGGQVTPKLFKNGDFSNGLVGYLCWDSAASQRQEWSAVEVVDAAKAGDTGVTLTGPMVYLPGRTSSGSGSALEKAKAGHSNLIQKLVLPKGSYVLTFDADFTANEAVIPWDIGIHTGVSDTYKRCSQNNAVPGLVVTATKRGTTEPIALTTSSTYKYVSLKTSATEAINASFKLEFTLTDEGDTTVYFAIGHNAKKTNPGHAYIDNIYLTEVVIPESTVTFDDLNDGTENEKITQPEGSILEFPTPKEREGYLFKGWYKDNGTFNEPATDVVPVDDITYYAKWMPFRANNWKGENKQPAGDGKEATPYEITNADELHWAVTRYGAASKGKYFKLMNDIVINDYSGEDWYKYTNDWHVSAWSGSGNKDFEGIFDGNGKVIRGLCVNSYAATDEIGGLFLTLGPNAVIKNVGIENAYIKTYKFAGAFAAATKNSGSTMTSEAAPQFIACYVGDGVYVETVSDGNWDNGFAGGFVGWGAFPMVFRYCYTKAEVKTATVGGNIAYGGAFVGGSNQGTDIIKYRSSYSYPSNPEYSMHGYSKSGGAKGTNTYATANKNGTTVIVKGVELVSDLSMVGEAAKTNMPNLDYEKIWKTVEGGTPVLRIFSEPDAIDPVTYIDPFEIQIVDDSNPGDIWSGGMASGFKSEKEGRSDGSEEKPHEISTAEELAYFHSLLTDSSYNNWKTEGKHYKITHDIYLNDVSKPNWYEAEGVKQWLIGTAQNQGINGTLDGDGHVVYGLFFDTDEEFVGLFPSIIKNGTVKRLGIASSYIFNVGTAAAMFSYVYNHSDYKTLPTVSECFIAEDVYIGSAEQGAAGFAGSLPAPIKIENCVFLGELEGVATKSAGLIGYSWLGDPKYPKYYEDGETHVMQEIYTSLVADDGRSQAVAYDGYDDFEKGYNTYTRGTSRAGISTQLPMSKMVGENAKAYLKDFDFENVWQAVDKGTPVLKCFVEKGVSTDLLSKALVPTVISFETYGGTKLDSIIGYATDPLKLPTPERNVDVFDGWYVYPHQTWDVKFTYDKMPEDDITLYAKWITNSIAQDFEKYPFVTADEYGLEGDFEIHRLGAIDFNSDHIYNGARTLRRLGYMEGYKNATLNNETPLIKGAKYQASMWIYLKSAPVAESELKLAYLQHADWAYDELATQTIYDLNKLPVGKWTEIKFDFVAYSEYLGISVPQCDVFFDDFEAIYTGATGLKATAVISKPDTITTIIPAEKVEQTDDEEEDTITTYKKIWKKKKVDSNSNGWWIYIVIAASAVVVIAAGGLAFILIRKKKLKK